MYPLGHMVSEISSTTNRLLDCFAAKLDKLRRENRKLRRRLQSLTTTKLIDGVSELLGDNVMYASLEEVRMPLVAITGTATRPSVLLWMNQELFSVPRARVDLRSTSSTICRCCAC